MSKCSLFVACIDIFSKYAWVVPLKTKQGQELVKAFQILSSARKPLKLQTDQGTEFLNRQFQKFLRNNSINFFTVNSRLKTSKPSQVTKANEAEVWHTLYGDNIQKRIRFNQPSMTNCVV